MPKLTELVIYTDESIGRGKYFSAFYGGALVHATDLPSVIDRLERAKSTYGFHAEIKWQKVTQQYLDRYTAVIDEFFDLIAASKVRIRIMFTPNSQVPTSLTKYHREHAYQLLYYQFFKHAFGLPVAGQLHGGVRLRLNMDQLPDTQEKNALFKDHLVSLGRVPAFRDAGVVIPRDQIAEVSSHSHVVLQCLDIALGAMQFRLNDKHKIKPAGSNRRGKKTIAKEKLYKHINERIRAIYPNFNIGISTGLKNGLESLWSDPYRHWRFVAAQSQFDPGKTKGK